jgi:spermidine synthase
VTPWQLIDSTPVPGSSQSLCLYRRGEEFAIRVGNRELMNSRMHASEDALADLACAKIADRPAPRVLIGASEWASRSRPRCVTSDPSEVIVAELVPAMVVWNRGPLGAWLGILSRIGASSFAKWMACGFSTRASGLRRHLARRGQRAEDLL